MFGKKRKSVTKKKRGLLRSIVAYVFMFGFLALSLYVAFQGVLAWEMFGSKKWELPARVYARPLELFPGLALDRKSLSSQLSLMGYRQEKRPGVPGTYSISNGTFTVHSRPFLFPDGHEGAKKIRVGIGSERVGSLMDIETGGNLAMCRLDPALIGSFYPESHQDRLWVKFEDAPPLLIQTVMAVEDRDFYEHHGVKPLSILRAIRANIVAGKTVQGGSTLTQQLVKNLFLTREKTFRRKFDEAIMALSLELFYDKDKLFEAYLNEVYLGQDGSRAIHGFGMASRFYFGRSLEHLNAAEIALLAGLLKGPAYYSPRRNPDRALERRNLVLKLMADNKLLRPSEAQSAMKTDLGVIADPRSGVSPFPHFMDIVKRSLLKEYDEQDLRTEGLRIFTTLDLRVQFAAEQAAEKRLKALEANRGMKAGDLEVAAVVTGAGNDEIAAVLGGRNPREPGFNRAIDANRPVGSLIKPAVYLAALTRPERYTLVTPLEDSPVEIKAKDGMWSPKNYDGVFHGRVPLFEALVFSYNAATVRLGMEVGLDRVFDTLRNLGVAKDFPPYPSALLGAGGMSPLEVARMYQTFAAGGYSTPARAIEAVYRPDGEMLQRYPLTVLEKVDPGAVYLLNRTLQTVVSSGTGRSMDRSFAAKWTPAGKTGTTNDLRDSWFAGFTGDYVAVVWIGRDDNRPCGLTGASGAMSLWDDIMGEISSLPLRLSRPDNVVMESIDPSTAARTDPTCLESISVPFLEGSEPQAFVPCQGAEYVEPDEQAQVPDKTRRNAPAKEKESGPSRFFKWFKGIF